MFKRSSANEPSAKTNYKIAVDSHVAASVHDDGVVILHTRKGRIFTSNRAGAAIWRCIEQRLSSGEIARKLEAQYRIDQPTAEQHTARFLAELESHSLIVKCEEEAKAECSVAS